MPMPAGCTPATPDQIAAVTQALSGADNQLSDAFIATTDGGWTVLVANLDSAAGERLSSADAWGWHPGSGDLYSISSGAQEYSVLPMSSGLADDPVADPIIGDQIGCLAASAQARNLGG